jgi:hypothetical protein
VLDTPLQTLLPPLNTACDVDTALWPDPNRMQPYWFSLYGNCKTVNLFVYLLHYLILSVTVHPEIWMKIQCFEKEIHFTPP